MARLILEYNSHVMRDYSLTNKSFSIGRHVDNNVVLDDPEVSGFHARIDKKGVDYILTDLQSTNGTLLNDENIISHRLLHGDRISIGGHAILFIGTEMAKAYEEELELNLNATTIRGAFPKRSPSPKPRPIERNESIGTERTAITETKAKHPGFLRGPAPVLLGILILIGAGWYFLIHEPVVMKNLLSAPVGFERNGERTIIQSNKVETDPLVKISSQRSNLQLQETSKFLEKDRVSPFSSVDQRLSSNQSRNISDKLEQTALNEVDELDFVLEGIVIASKPEDSFAVINGRMVRAGGTVDGATVVKITNRQVIIRYPKGGSENQLTLR